MKDESVSPIEGTRNVTKRQKSKAAKTYDEVEETAREQLKGVFKGKTDRGREHSRQEAGRELTSHL